MKKSRFIAAAVTAALFFALSAKMGGLLEAEDAHEVLSKLTDCFTVAGVVLFGVGALSWGSSKGAYDVMSYGVNWLIKPFTSSRDKYESFYDFKMRKAEERSEWKKEFLLSGLGLIAIALVLLAAYYAVG